jgi:hypothetical protein
MAAAAADHSEAESSSSSDSEEDGREGISYGDDSYAKDDESASKEEEVSMAEDAAAGIDVQRANPSAAVGGAASKSTDELKDKRDDDNANTAKIKPNTPKVNWADSQADRADINIGSGGQHALSTADPVSGGEVPTSLVSHDGVSIGETTTTAATQPGPSLASSSSPAYAEEPPTSENDGVGLGKAATTATSQGAGDPNGNLTRSGGPSLATSTSIGCTELPPTSTIGDPVGDSTQPGPSLSTSGAGCVEEQPKQATGTGAAFVSGLPIGDAKENRGLDNTNSSGVATDAVFDSVREPVDSMTSEVYRPADNDAEAQAVKALLAGVVTSAPNTQGMESDTASVTKTGSSQYYIGTLKERGPRPQHALTREADSRETLRINSERQLWKSSPSLGNEPFHHSGEWNKRHQLTYSNNSLQQNVRSYFDRCLPYKEPTAPSKGAMKPSWRLTTDAPTAEERSNERAIQRTFSAMIPPEVEPAAPQLPRRREFDEDPNVFDRLWTHATKEHPGPHERPLRPFPGGGGGSTIEVSPAGSAPPRLRSQTLPAERARKTRKKSKRPEWEDRHHLAWSNEMHLLLPYRTGTGKVLTPLVLRNYFDRPRKEQEVDAPRGGSNPPQPVWRLEPNGAEWRLRQAESASEKAASTAFYYSWEFLRTVNLKAAQPNVHDRDRALADQGGQGSVGNDDNADQPQHWFEPAAPSDQDDQEHSGGTVTRMGKKMRDPSRPYLPGPGGGGCPCARLVEPPPPGLPDNGRGLPLTRADEAGRRGWHDRHSLTFKNEDASILDRSYFDRFRDPASLQTELKKQKGNVQARSTAAWSLGDSGVSVEAGNMIAENSAYRGRPTGKWNPRHDATFKNDLQPNSRSYFDRMREPDDPSGAPLPPGVHLQPNGRLLSRSTIDLSDSHATPTLSAHRRQKGKLTNASKLTVDWKISERDDGVADGTVMRSGIHKGETFGTIVRRDPDYVKATLLASLSQTDQEEFADGTWLRYLQKRYVLIQHADGTQFVIPSDTTSIEFGKHRGKTFKQIADNDPEYIEFSLVTMGDRKGGSHPQCSDWLKYLRGWYELRREPDTVLEDGSVLANYVVDPIEVTVASTSLPRLSQTRSESSLRALKLERRRTQDLKARGRADQAEFVRRAALNDKKKEEAWFSSHSIHF